jgi:fructokinase
MQIGIDLGATKIEYVVLSKNGKEIIRSRVKTPNNYRKAIKEIKNIVLSIDKIFKKKLNVGICHPGSIDKNTGLVKNSTNATWLNKKKLNLDLKKILKRNVFCENDANCFTLSESTDGSAKHYKVVFGIILGSGTGGGIVINKKILTGSNHLAGEWGHMAIPIFGNLEDKKFIQKNIKKMEIETFVSGKGLEKLYKKKLSAHMIFNKENKNKFDRKFIKNFKLRLARSLVNLIYTLDPDAIVFGGGLSNEITFLNELKSLLIKNLKVKNLNTVFLKPDFGDASGVRGAAMLGRKSIY